MQNSHADRLFIGNIGDAMADALLWYRTTNNSKVDGAIMNAGGLRASIDAGNVTRSDVLTTFPFLNAATDLKLTGQQLWDLFEGMSDSLHSKYIPDESFYRRRIPQEQGGSRSHFLRPNF